MVFSELYSAYYNTVAKIITSAVDHPIPQKEVREIINRMAFSESLLNIEPSITEQNWQLLFDDGTTPLKHKPTMPITTLQKRWLKSVSLDPRIQLFDMDFSWLEGVEPLFTPQDYYVFDKYSDGDNYTDEKYIKHFKRILDAIKNRYPLSINLKTRHDKNTYVVMMPEYLEYSEKDDKFRLIGSNNVINVGRIESCKPYKKENEFKSKNTNQTRKRVVELEVQDERNALERVLLHFAHFEKEALKLEDGKYNIKITYDKDDETEIVIRILSFGPMIKVISPSSFVNLIKDRLIKQKSCVQ